MPICSRMLLLEVCMTVCRVHDSMSPFYTTASFRPPMPQPPLSCCTLARGEATELSNKLAVRFLPMHCAQQQGARRSRSCVVCTAYLFLCESHRHVQSIFHLRHARTTPPLQEARGKRCLSPLMAVTWRCCVLPCVAALQRPEVLAALGAALAPFLNNFQPRPPRLTLPRTAPSTQIAPLFHSICHEIRSLVTRLLCEENVGSRGLSMEFMNFIFYTANSVGVEPAALQNSGTLSRMEAAATALKMSTCGEKCNSCTKKNHQAA